MIGKDYKYYQPERYYDDGTNIEWSFPDELPSWRAFRSKEECVAWLKNNGYEPEDFTIHEYKNDDIEDVQIIDENGDVILKIEELWDDEIEIILTNEVLKMTTSPEDLMIPVPKLENEDDDQYKDRLYGLALDKVNEAIDRIEDSGDYDFSSYAGDRSDSVEWYDEARDEAVRTITLWLMGESI